ncbi:hypothetical protein ACFL1E_07595 [Candidatus Omnitrophota bacterium]
MSQNRVARSSGISFVEVLASLLLIAAMFFVIGFTYVSARNLRVVLGQKMTVSSHLQTIAEAMKKIEREQGIELVYGKFFPNKEEVTLSNWIDSPLLPEEHIVVSYPGGLPASSGGSTGGGSGGGPGGTFGSDDSSSTPSGQSGKGGGDEDNTPFGSGTGSGTSGSGDGSSDGSSTSSGWISKEGSDGHEVTVPTSSTQPDGPLRIRIEATWMNEEKPLKENMEIAL